MDEENEGDAAVATFPTTKGHAPIESPRTDDAFSTRANSIVRSGSTGEAIIFPKSASKALDTYADAVIFMGDLNYRIKGNR